MWDLWDGVKERNAGWAGRMRDKIGVWRRLKEGILYASGGGGGA